MSGYTERQGLVPRMLGDFTAEKQIELVTDTRKWPETSLEFRKQGYEMTWIVLMITHSQLLDFDLWRYLLYLQLEEGLDL